MSPLSIVVRTGALIDMIRSYALDNRQSLVRRIEVRYGWDTEKWVSTRIARELRVREDSPGGRIRLLQA